MYTHSAWAGYIYFYGPPRKRSRIVMRCIASYCIAIGNKKYLRGGGKMETLQP